MAGIAQFSISGMAVWCLREALETDDEKQTVALLPLALTWISHCRHNLLTHSIRRHSYSMVPLTLAPLIVPGVMARRADVDQDGLSMKRWLFWRRRLQTLSCSKDPRVSGDAWDGFMNMISCGRDLNFTVEGEAAFAEALQKATDKALAAGETRGMKVDDIEIKVGWFY